MLTISQEIFTSTFTICTNISRFEVAPVPFLLVWHKLPTDMLGRLWWTIEMRGQYALGLQSPLCESFHTKQGIFGFWAFLSSCITSIGLDLPLSKLIKTYYSMRHYRTFHTIQCGQRRAILVGILYCVRQKVL